MSIIVQVGGGEKRKYVDPHRDPRRFNREQLFNCDDQDFAAIIDVKEYPTTMPDLNLITYLTFNFERKEIEGDGNCLFASLSHWAYKELPHNVSMRMQMCNAYNQFPDLRVQMWDDLAALSEQPVGTPEEFLKACYDYGDKEIEKSGAWAGAGFIRAAARLFSVTIVTHIENGSSSMFWKADPEEGVQSTCVWWLWFDGENQNHYEVYKRRRERV
jgi:hypothetical protein